jgi:hypothetical protein
MLDQFCVISLTQSNAYACNKKDSTSRFIGYFNVQLPQQDPATIAKWWEEAASKVPKQERGSTELSFTLYGTNGRREIGGSSKTNIKRFIRWPQ